jgi:hypothetical protein
MASRSRARHKPQQVAFAAAMRTIALDDLLKLAFDLEPDTAAMTTAFVTH